METGSVRSKMGSAALATTCTVWPESHISASNSFHRRFGVTAFGYNISNTIPSWLRSSQGGRMETGSVSSKMCSIILQHLIGRKVMCCALPLFA